MEDLDPLIEQIACWSRVASLQRLKSNLVLQCLPGPGI